MYEQDFKLLISKLRKAQDKGNKKEEETLYFEIVKIYLDNGDFKRAKLTLEDILRVNPSAKKANYNLAIVELNLGNKEKAITYLEKELHLDPSSKESRELKNKLIIDSNFPIITITLILLNSIVFYFTFPEIALIDLIKFTLNSNSSNFLASFSSIFFHINLSHFLINMIMLLMFGLYLEKNIGSIKFLTIFLISAILGNLIQMLTSNDAFILGASAGIFGLMGAVLMREPLLNMRIFGIFKVPIILIFGLMFSLEDFIASYLFNNSLFFANLAHISGFLLGILITSFFYRDNLNSFFNWLGIALGFWLIFNSLSIFQFITSTFILSAFLYQLFFMIFGIFSIYYSYSKLKLLQGGIE